QPARGHPAVRGQRAPRPRARLPHLLRGRPAPGPALRERRTAAHPRPRVLPRGRARGRRSRPRGAVPRRGRDGSPRPGGAQAQRLHGGLPGPHPRRAAARRRVGAADRPGAGQPRPEGRHRWLAMASDKSQRTEKPTPKRKREARKKGQVARSPELVAWATLLLASVLVQTTIRLGAEHLRELFTEVTASIQNPTPRRALEVLADGLSSVLSIIAPLALGFAALAIVGNLAQVGIYASFQRIKPKFNRVNPFKGLRNMFSTRSAWESVKAILRFLILAAIAWPVLSNAAHTLAGGANLETAVSTTADAAVGLIRNTAAAGLVLAAVD